MQNPRDIVEQTELKQTVNQCFVDLFANSSWHECIWNTFIYKVTLIFFSQNLFSTNTKRTETYFLTINPEKSVGWLQGSEMFICSEQSFYIFTTASSLRSSDVRFNILYWLLEVWGCSLRCLHRLLSWLPLRWRCLPCSFQPHLKRTKINLQSKTFFSSSFSQFLFNCGL